MKSKLREEIERVVTYHGDDGTSGYDLSNEQIDELVNLFQSKMEEVIPKKIELVNKKGFYGTERELEDRSKFETGFNQAIDEIIKKLSKMKEEL